MTMSWQAFAKEKEEDLEAVEGRKKTTSHVEDLEELGIHETLIRFGTTSTKRVLIRALIGRSGAPECRAIEANPQGRLGEH